MCDEFICSDSGVGLCEDDRILLESLGNRKSKSDVQTNDEKCNKNVEKGGNKIDDEEADNNNDMAETNRNISEHDSKDKDSGRDTFMNMLLVFFHGQIQSYLNCIN